MTSEAVGSFKTALASGVRSDVNDSALALLSIDAPLGAGWRSVAAVLLHNGEVSKALEAMKRFVSAYDGAADACYEQGVFVARSGRLTEARDILHGITGATDLPGFLFAKASVALELGEFARANELLDEVVANRPSAGTAWLSLAKTGALSEHRRAVALLNAAPEIAKAPISERAAWHYAAGHMYAAASQYEKAFLAFSQGASLAGSFSAYDRAADAANARRATEGSVRRDASTLLSDVMPILVCGLPRSGTTLVEHILASHSLVAGGGELNLWRIVAQDAGGHSAKCAPQGSDMLARLYVHLTSEHVGCPGRAVDKSLNTSRFLGLAMNILPDMPVIWVRRDPLDCAWSCFSNRLVSGADWSVSLTDMAHHFRIEDNLYRHWSQQLGDRMLTIQYERLVDDPQYWTRKILDHCGLDNESAPYKPHLTDRAVRTASAVQVRRPINRYGLNVSQSYRGYLKPFVTEYALG